MGNLADRPTALYRFFDAEGRLLYVGIAHDPEKRWATHRLYQGWWHLVANKTHEWFPDRAAAKAAEDKALIDEMPRFDGSHIGNQGSRYREDGSQYVDPRKPQIEADLRAAIKRGEFPRGRTLPAATVLAERYGTSPQTIRSVFWKLSELGGLLEGHGKNYWLRGDQPR
jgi:hypothetical protein